MYSFIKSIFLSISIISHCFHYIATTQLNSTQSWVGLIFLSETKPNRNRNRPPLFLSSYTTKLNQIQDATLFQPN